MLLSADDPDAILHGLFALVGPQLGVDACFNYMVDETGSALRLATYIGIPAETARSIERLEFGQAICGTVAMTCQSIAATHIQQSDDPQAQLVKSIGLRAFACSPLISDDVVLGTLAFGSRTRDEFDPDELIVLQTICHYVAVAYDRFRLLHKLRETDRRKDEFLAMLGHELRNPLAPIINSVQLLSLQKNEGKIQQQARTIIERQVGQLTRLVDDLLEVSRITTGKIRLQQKQTALNDIVERAVESVRPLMSQRGHELTVPPSLLPPIWVNADAVRLEQVIVNLLTNAAKYTADGGRISVTVQQEGDKAVLRVRDSGVGIAPELLPHVFDLFTQAERSLDRSQGGLGIGLCLVQRLVEMHGGRVDVSSTVGQGSEFVVRLPVMATSIETAEPTGRSLRESAGGLTPPRSEIENVGGLTPSRSEIENVDPTRRSLRVLVVDDNVDAALSLQLLLTTAGHDVWTAYTGPTALQAVLDFKPNVMLLDLGLPGLDGYEVAKRLRHQPDLSHVVLVAMTGYGQDSDRKRSLAAGFNHHLVKPANFEEVIQILATVSATP